MRRDFTLRKRVILAFVILLVVADVALAAYSWQLSAAPHAPQKQLSLETKQHSLLKADIERVQKIRDNIPATQKECDLFERSLFPASSGYSAVRSELDAMAGKSGIQLEDLAFKRTEISSRGITEVAVDATVNGNYKNMIVFLNALQRSPNLYAVDNLTLASDTSHQASTNVIKVALHLKTYFRTGG
jgi:Tfp pilus assembly protein PilO